MPRVTLNIPADLLGEVRELAGPRQLSAYVIEALRHQLGHDRLDLLLDEMDEEAGPIPDDVMVEVDKQWRAAVESIHQHRRSA